jgi:hypothetical protein
VLVHIESPEPVDLETNAGGGGWRSVCTSPCDRSLPAGESYRVSGSGVPESLVFVLQPAPRATLKVDPSNKHSRVGGTLLTVLGVIGLVPGIGVTATVASFTIGGAVLVCPIAAAFSANYGKCVGGAAGLAVPLYASPVVWGPALAGAGLTAIGVTWLVMTAGGHGTNVDQTVAATPSQPAPTAFETWTVPRRVEVALPPVADLPIVSATF